MNDKLYLVSEGYYDYEGGGKEPVAIFTTFELAEEFVEKIIPLIHTRDFYSKEQYKRTDINMWDLENSSSFIEIEEMDLDINYIPEQYLPRTPNK